MISRCARRASSSRCSASLLVSLVWTNAFAAATVGDLNQMSVAFNVVIIGLGGELGIHVCMRYAELAAQGRSRQRGARPKPARRSGARWSRARSRRRSASWCSSRRISAASRELGLISGCGCADLVWRRADARCPPCSRSATPAAPQLRALDAAADRAHPAASAAVVRPPDPLGALAVAIGCWRCCPRARFDHNPLNLRDPNTESVQTFLDLLGAAQTSPWTIDVVAPDLAPGRDERGAARERCRYVKRAITLDDFVPAQQPRSARSSARSRCFVPRARADEPNARCRPRSAPRSSGSRRRSRRRRADGRPARSPRARRVCATRSADSSPRRRAGPDAAARAPADECDRGACRASSGICCAALDPGRRHARHAAASAERADARARRARADPGVAEAGSRGRRDASSSSSTACVRWRRAQRARPSGWSSGAA